MTVEFAKNSRSVVTWRPPCGESRLPGSDRGLGGLDSFRNVTAKVCHFLRKPFVRLLWNSKQNLPGSCTFRNGIVDATYIASKRQ